MHRSRRFLLASLPAVAAFAGCTTAGWGPVAADERQRLLEERIYTCSYDGTAFGLEDGGDEPTLAWRYDAGNMIYGVAITLENEVYVATNDGKTHALRESQAGADADSSELDGPKLEWTYQHTSYEGDAPSDSIFFDGLAHQVAADPTGGGIYSCGYDGTTHALEDDDGTPRRIWEHDGHTDNVREVRVHGEYLGTHLELWGVEPGSDTDSE